MVLNLLHVSYQRRREKKRRRRQRMAKVWVKSKQSHQERRKRWKRKGQRQQHSHLRRTLKHRVQGESPWLNPPQHRSLLPQLVR